jgi:hypothetical protein
MSVHKNMLKKTTDIPTKTLRRTPCKKLLSKKN